MATKSILKTIAVKSKKSCNSLVNALENAKDKSKSEVKFSRSVRTADDDMIKKIFGERK